ncbi:MAG: phosphoglucomutase/phosphomannomutase family protein [Candidatus Gastranaerophilales bacterium]|nr:phosphoglucomutase/phosphomannomutase family protein [Candidatus Gastranaerophilales bacterium]
MANIKFGTDGWRAIVGEGFNPQNVEIVTNAIGKYVFDSFGLKKKILIGYDPRNMAKEFAQQCADLLSNQGFEVIISKEIIPTPVLAYGAKLYNACAIMFTASHNPPKYLGMKFIPDYAGPATTKITDAIVANLGKKIPQNHGKIEKFSFKEPYIKHLQEIIHFEKIKTLQANIIFDGLYSATIGYFDKILDEFSIPYQSLHMEHDPSFGGGMPEPKPKYLKELIKMIKSSQNTIGLSNDGDGDRFGIVNEKGEFLSPNEVIAILLLYLKNTKKLEGALVKTVSGSFLLDKIAQKLGIEVIETAVGFKNVGEAMRKYNAIIGGEESGGLSIQGHIPEKDGILANLLILEVMAVKNKTLFELQEEIYEFVGTKFFNERIDLKLENQELVRTSIEKAKKTQEIGSLKVIKTDLKDGVKLYLDDNLSWILIRPSGTEPLLRIYFESDSLEKVEKLKSFLEVIKR